MTIDEYIEKNSKPETINGIKFQLYNVNYHNDADVNTPTNYDGDDILRKAQATFLERLDLAREELEEDTKDMTAAEAMAYYKKNTSDGNCNYWGHMIFVPTYGESAKTTRRRIKPILYGVRMD